VSQPIGLDPKLIPLKGPRQTTLSLRDEQRLRNAAADFESLFIKQMLSSMRKAVPKDENGGLIRESQGEKIFRDMLDSEYANIASRRGSTGMGLGEMMFKQLIQRYQISANGKSSASQADKAVVAAQQGLDKVQGETHAMQAAQFGPKNAGK